jgi:hypothetical protein
MCLRDKMILTIPVVFLSFSLLFSTMSLTSIVAWTLVGLAIGIWITWIQIRTEFQKLVQPVRSEFTLSGALDELPHLHIKWNGRTLLNGAVIHEMIKTFIDVMDSKVFCFDIENTHPNPTFLTVPTGTYKRFTRKAMIGWEPVEQPKPTAEIME